ncbi:MAG: hypothetical protein BWY41_01109 [Candidatus Atribacteria bacterium ADurb.Bin276]|uniref:Uncharacterized protein n=1 Tax=Candidatus Atribacter allofermentans TaxID=1852833 RepID=A0A1V5SV87_9BACT|nr:MAG: hypothetical protein BWY41_01109 [Candidatus Atribacteria bacterium ADurb.Bin276]
MLKASYKLEEIEEAIKAENPYLSQKEVQQKAKSLYREIIKLDNQERKNNQKYYNNIDFSGDNNELDVYLQSKGICAGIDGQKAKLVTPKNVPVASRAD